MVVIPSKTAQKHASADQWMWWWDDIFKGGTHDLEMVLQDLLDFKTPRIDYLNVAWSSTLKKWFAMVESVGKNASIGTSNSKLDACDALMRASCIWYWNLHQPKDEKPS